MVFKDIDKKLRKNGWVRVRVKGSHNIYKREDFFGCISVPDHGKESISTGVLRTLERDTGLLLR